MAVWFKGLGLWHFWISFDTAAGVWRDIGFNPTTRLANYKVSLDATFAASQVKLSGLQASLTLSVLNLSRQLRELIAEECVVQALHAIGTLTPCVSFVDTQSPVL